MENVFTQLFFGGDSATPNPVAHAVFGFIRTALIFVLVFILQFVIDAVVNQKDLLTYSTWQALFVPLAVVILEFIWRYARAVNSPLAFIFKGEETKISEKTGVAIPEIPKEIDLDLPHPPAS